MSRIDCWFPTPIYVAEKICEDIIPVLEKEIKVLQSSGTTRNPMLYVDTLWSSPASRTIKHQYPFNILASEILDNAVVFANELGYKVSKDDLHIDNMWANISNEGDFNFPHSHGDCYFSGAFYVKTIPENEIYFYHPEFLTGAISFPDEFKPLSFEHVKYPCVESTLMMWRSNLIHSTPRQMVSGEKIVISYNISIKKEYN